MQQARWRGTTFAEVYFSLRAMAVAEPILLSISPQRPMSADCPADTRSDGMEAGSDVCTLVQTLGQAKHVALSWLRLCMGDTMSSSARPLHPEMLCAMHSSYCATDICTVQ